MTEPIVLTTPLSEEDVSRLRIGDRVLLNGVLYTARDAAHARLVALLDRGEELPIDLRGQVIYFAGPSPAKPGKVIGSIGPTTGSRMDAYSPKLIARGLKGMIGKGSRAPQVIEAMVQYKSVYFGATGGAAALLAKAVKKSQVVAYEDLGPEAIVRLEVENFPVVVINDTQGGDLYREGRKQYQKEIS
ncbi:MAG: Fe-S-containing hydro-lyase [Candidatus Tectomicrobia bacterium]|uniref:Fe-S-containing hydro-lyase n=1 Tax=Tectimicrobiota bacterium TaxID=2528274 RepID=A0A932CLS0_UNCTE|nr:Fe-S-containing hydro-lyase [Candidatus Tectomicrobia bacterium]